MAQERIANLGEIGINSDVVNTLLPPNALTFLKNVLPEDGSLRTAPGERHLFDLNEVIEPLASETWANIQAVVSPALWDVYELADAPLDAPKRLDGSDAVVGDRLVWDNNNWVNHGPGPTYRWIEPIYHTSYTDFSQKQWVVVSDGVRVLAFDMEGVSEDITPSPSMNGGFVSFTSLNGILVVNSANTGPYYWDGPGFPNPPNPLTPLPNWDPTWLCRQMIAHRYGLFALNMTENSVEYPHKIRWSSSAPEGYPPDSWDPTDLAKDAGSDTLGETEGVVMGASRVRSMLYVIKEDGIYQVRRVDGDWIYAIERLQGTIGTTAPRGWIEMQGALAVFNTTDLLLFDGQQQVSITDGRVAKSIFQTINEQYWEKSQLYYHQPTGNLYVAAVSEGSKLTSAFVYNQFTQSWGHKDLHHGYGFDTAFVSVNLNSPRWDDFSPNPVGGVQPLWLLDGTWDEQTIGTWNKGLYDPSVPDVLLYESNEYDAGDDERLRKYWVSAILPHKWTNWDDTPKNCIVRRDGIPLNGASGQVMLTGVWPEMHSIRPEELAQGVVFRFGTQNVVNGAITWARNRNGGTEFTYDPQHDSFIDPRVSGRFLVWEMTSNAPLFWDLAALTLEYEDAGAR